VSAKVEAWVWEQKLPTNQKIILVLLASWANDDGVVLAPHRQEDIADRVGMQRTTTQSHLKNMRGGGLLQMVEHRDENGHKLPSTYRIMVPWAYVGNPDVGDSNVGAAPSASLSSSSPPHPPNNTSHSTTPKTLRRSRAAQPEHLGGSRWRVSSSRPGKGPYVIDLAARTCSCEARVEECKHMRAATAAQERAETVRRKALHDAVWDALDELFGKAPSRQKAGRGALVMDVVEHLTNEKIEQTPEAWRAEVLRRHRALVNQWRGSLPTAHSFVQNFFVAGRAVRSPGRSTTLEQDDETEEDRELRRRYTRA
jgi:hypothetical protein